MQTGRSLFMWCESDPQLPQTLCVPSSADSNVSRYDDRLVLPGNVLRRRRFIPFLGQFGDRNAHVRHPVFEDVSGRGLPAEPCDVAGGLRESPLHRPHCIVEPVQGLLRDFQSKGRAKAVVTGRAAVIVQVDAVGDRRPDEAEHLRALVLHCVAVARHGACDAEINAEARPQPLDVGWDAMTLENRVEARVESIGDLEDMLVEAGLLIGGDGGQAGGDCHRVAVVRAAMLAVSQWHEAVHDVAAASEYAERLAAPDRLAQCAKVGGDSEVLLRAARGHAERRQYLIEDQQHAVVARQPAEGRHELRRRDDAAGIVVDRLTDHRRHLPGVDPEGPLEQFRVVVRHQYEILVQARRDPGRPWVNRRRSLGAQPVGGRVDGEHHLIVVAVEVALELEDLLLSGEGAGQAEAVHGRLAARAGEAHALQARHRFAEQAGECGVRLVLVRAGCTAVEGLLDGPTDAWVAVPQERGPVTAAEVEVLKTVQVPQSAAFGPIEENRVAECLVHPGGRGDAGRQVVARLLVLLDDATHPPLRLCPVIPLQAYSRSK